MLQLGIDSRPEDALVPPFSTFIVFGNACKLNAHRAGFGECSKGLMRQWINVVTIPSLYRAMRRNEAGRIVRAGSYDLLQSNNWAARLEGMSKVPDPPMSVPVMGST